MKVNKPLNLSEKLVGNLAKYARSDEFLELIKFLESKKVNIDLKQG